MIEVRPLSIVLDNPNPMNSSTTDVKEDTQKNSTTSSRDNQMNSHEKLTNNNIITENANYGQQMVPQTVQSPPNETYYPPYPGIYYLFYLI